MHVHLFPDMITHFNEALISQPSFILAVALFLSVIWQKGLNRRYHLQDGVIGKKRSERLPLKFYGESFGEIKNFGTEIFNFR